MTRSELIEAMARALVREIDPQMNPDDQDGGHGLIWHGGAPYARAALAAVEAAGCVIVPGWRTMESAPKDGTEVLAYQPWMNRAVVARFECDRYAKKPRPFWSMTNRSLYDRDNQPTHWMPLPAPPASPVTKDA